MIYVYAVSPIDAWMGWLSEEEYLASLREQTVNWEYDKLVKRLRDRAKLALELSKRVGFEGDVTVGPLISGIPAIGGDSHCEFLIGWKQYNNGTTFIASPYRLPWIEGDARMVTG